MWLEHSNDVKSSLRVKEVKGVKGP
jgi:hypothetical protein